MEKSERVELGLQALQVAEAIELVMEAMVSEHGLAREAVIAGVHAQAVAAMVMAYGGAEAGARMRAAADEIAPLPSLSDALLAARQPHGTA